MSAPVAVDVRAVLAALVGSTARMAAGEAVSADPATVTLAEQTLAAVAELIAADLEHDAARTEFEDLNRRIAESGWIDVEFDALRKAGNRFAGARLRRADALARVWGAE